MVSQVPKRTSEQSTGTVEENYMVINFLKWNLKDFFALNCIDTLQVVSIHQEMSSALSHCQEADQIVKPRNFAFLQSEDKKGRLGSCVCGEMWEHKFAEARSCVSNEVNSFNLKCSVFSISVSAVTYHDTQWRCLVALSAPVSVFCSTAATDHFQR